MNDQLVAKAAIYTINNKHKRQTSVYSVKFETLIPGIVRPQTYALDHTEFRELAKQKKYGNPL